MELSYKIWDGPDGLNAEHERRNKIKEAGKQKQFTKRITGLLMSYAMSEFYLAM